MTWMHSPILWFFLGVLATILFGIGLPLYLTNAFPRKQEQTDYTPIIRIHTTEQAEAVRSRLISFLFGSPILPGTTPHTDSGGMRIEMPNGFTSLVTVYPHVSQNEMLVIYHTGHEGCTGRDRAAIRTFQRAGYPVWRLDLPLTGDNPREAAVTLPEAGKVLIRQHRQFAYLDELTPGSPLRYFIEPVVALVNQAQLQGYRDIFTVGLSGGGWTVQVAAAVDVRIRASYPVAAGVPLGLRFDRDRKNWGDWEENLPALQRIAGFEDLSILGAASRSQIQVLNEFDLSCYNEPRCRIYEPAIRQVVEALGGNYAVHWSRGEFMHRANPGALDVILADMQSRRS
jgi:pimeloyl-ACP methyl ester carboxylesterase